MKAIILCEEKIDQIYYKNIFVKFAPTEAVIITTENSLYHEIRETYPLWKCEFMYLYDDDEFEKSKRIADYITNKIKERIKEGETKNIAEISINSMYEIYARVIVQVEKQIVKLKELYDFRELYLYGGNQRVPFFPLNMAEGERPFRFMYRRSWFLNPVINGLFANDLNIHWQQELSSLLALKRSLRLLIFNVGKMCKIGIKHSRARKANDGEPLYENEYIGIIVRTLNQANSVISLYRAIKSKTNYEPILLLYENYSNNELVDFVAGKGLNYLDVRESASLCNAIHCYLRTKTCNNRKDRRVSINSNIAVDSVYLSKEMKFQWWDALLLMNAFEKAIRKRNIRLKSVLNIETYNWIAAAQAKWANKMNLPIYSIQFVTLDIRPHMVWADKYYFMTLDEKKKYRSYVTDEKCGYVGPVCYDDIFNSTTHKQGGLNRIVIFTQPDSLRNDSIRIVEDVLRIREESGFRWEVCIKLHPRENDADFFRNKYGDRKKVSVVLNEENSTDLLIDSDLAVGIVSTTLYQSVIIGTPAISVNYDNLTNYKLDVIEAEVVKKIVNYDGLKDYLSCFETYEKSYYSNRGKYLRASLGNYCGRGAEELAYILKEEIDWNKSVV